LVKYYDYRGKDRCIEVIGGNLERKRPLLRPGHRWKDYIKMCILERAWREP